MDHLVFVYGTLRRGCPNHALLEGRAQSLGPGRTKLPYALYVDADGIPYVKEDEPRHPIAGELYLVGDAALADLDALEEHPDDYERREVPVILDDGTGRVAWLYFHPAPPGRLFSGGDFLCALARRPS